MAHSYAALFISLAACGYQTPSIAQDATALREEPDENVQNVGCGSDADFVENVSFSMKPRDRKISSSLTVASVRTFTGKCADKIVYAHFGGVATSDKKAFSYNEGKLSKIDDDFYSKWINDFPQASFSPPNLIGLEYVSATSLGPEFNSSSSKKIIGLWRGSGGSTLALFSTCGGKNGRPIIIGKLDGSFSSISHFPSPDSNRGIITLLSNEDSKTVIVSLDWNGAEIARVNCK